MDLIKILDPDIRNTKDFFSPSSILKWRNCRVCWAAKYLDKIDKGDNVYSEKGKRVHKLLEEYLRDGKPIDPRDEYGKIALAGIKHLPPPRQCEVEEPFKFEHRGIRFGGQIDFWYQNESGLYVGDHKTTTRLENSLSHERLKNHIQSNLYALFLMGKNNVDEINLNWVYYKSTGVPDSKQVLVKTTLTEVLNNVSLAIEDCYDMQKAKDNRLSALDFKPPIEGCRDFGQCAAELFGVKNNMSGKKLEDLLAEKDEPVSLNPPPAMEQTENGILEAVNESVRGLHAIGLLDEKEVQKYDQFRLEALDALSEQAQQLNMGYGIKAIHTLHINSIPKKLGPGEHIIQLSDLLKPVFKKIAKDKGVSHYRFISYEAQAVIATYLDQELENNPPKQGAQVLISTASAEGRDCLMVLEHHSERVIVGGVI